MWKRIKIKNHPSGNGWGEGPDLALARRYLGLDGKPWPRMTVGVYPNVYPKYNDDGTLQWDVKSVTGFTIQCAYKKKSSDWWQSDSISAFVPIECYNDILEMLDEVKKS